MITNSNKAGRWYSDLFVMQISPHTHPPTPTFIPPKNKQTQTDDIFQSGSAE